MQDAIGSQPKSTGQAGREPDGGTQYVLFTAGTRIFTLPLDDVLEVIEPEWWVRIPHAAGWVKGLLYHHGDPLVVANIGALLEGPAAAGHDRASVLRLRARDLKFGILVDRVLGTWRTDSPATPCREAELVKGVWERKGKLVSLIDFDALLDTASRVFNA